MPFIATARIPNRPLSYENVDMAVPKEVIIDYKTGEIYVKKENGEVIGITSALILALKEKFETDPTIGDSLTITIKEDVVLLSEQIINMLADIDEIKKMLEALGIKIEEVEGQLQIKIEIKAGDIVEDNDHMFVTYKQLEQFKQASIVHMLTATIKGGAANWTGSAAPYSQKVDIPHMKESYYPIIDVKLSSDYEAAQKELEAYGCLYKIETYDGYILCFATQVPEQDFNVNIKCDEPVTTLEIPDPPAPEIPDPGEPEEPTEPTEP